MYTRPMHPIYIYMTKLYQIPHVRMQHITQCNNNSNLLMTNKPLQSIMSTDVQELTYLNQCFNVAKPLCHIRMWSLPDKILPIMLFTVGHSRPSLNSK